MNLAERCEALWPCDWKIQRSSPLAVPVAEAYNVQGLPVEVVFDEGRYHVYIRSWSERNEDLHTVLSLAHSYLKNLPPVPDLVEVTVSQQAEEILAAQGWKKCLVKNWWGSDPFWVDLCPERVALWYRGHCVKTIVLVQGTVREQLKELLTFPQWKEP